MVTSAKCCGSSDVCHGAPCHGTPAAVDCEECMSFKEGICRGRDPKIPMQVTFGVVLLGLIFVGATMFS